MRKSLLNAVEYAAGVLGLGLTMWLCFEFTLALFGGGR